MKRKIKNILTKILTAVLAVGVVAGTAAGAKALYDYSKEELKVIHPTFNVGGLDSDGEYIKDDTKLYSNEFKCQGLDIKLDFDSDIKYQIFFYESDGDFIESTEVLEEDYNEESSIFATHARVMIIPKWTNVEATEDKTLEELKVVNWKNISTFASQLEIKVNKEQVELDDINYLDPDKSELNKVYNFMNHELVDVDRMNTSMIDITEFFDSEDEFEIVIKYPKKLSNYYYETLFNILKMALSEGDYMIAFTNFNLTDNTTHVDKLIYTNENTSTIKFNLEAIDLDVFNRSISEELYIYYETGNMPEVNIVKK